MPVDSAPEVRRLRDLLPDGIALAVADPATADVAALPAEEARLVAGAPAERQRQFAAGRWCARQALAAVGLPVAALPATARGVPRWPEGVRGSIAHTAGLAVAVAAPADAVVGLGVDVEPATGLPNEVWIATLSDAERRRTRALRPPAAAVRMRLLVSAKEAYAKWHTSLGGTRDLSFLDGEAHVDGTTLEVVPHDPALPTARGAAVTGRRWLLTVLW